MRSLVLAFAALTAAACGHARPKAPPPAPIPVERPVISVTAARVDSLGFAGLDVVFSCRIENPNGFPLSIVSVSYAVALEGRTAAAGSTSAPLFVAPATPAGAGVAALDVPVGVRFANVPAFAPLLALDRDAELALTGAVTFETPGGRVAVPLSHLGRVAIPRAPRFRVGRATLRSASPFAVKLDMAVDVQNPNAFAIPAGRIRYGLFMSDREVARTELVVADPIAPGATAALAVPLEISMLKAGKAAARFLLPFASLDVGVRGEAVFGGVPVPLDLAASVLPR
jgi:LEA14-like dessication related protein